MSGSGSVFCAEEVAAVAAVALDGWRAVHRYKCCSQSKCSGTIIHADTVRQSPAQLCTPHFSLSVILCLYPTRDLGRDVIDGADEDGAPTPYPPTAVYTECFSLNPWSDD